DELQTTMREADYLRMSDLLFALMQFELTLSRYEAFYLFDNYAELPTALKATIFSAILPDPGYLLPTQYDSIYKMGFEDSSKLVRFMAALSYAFNHPGFLRSKKPVALEVRRILSEELIDREDFLAEGEVRGGRLLGQAARYSIDLLSAPRCVTVESLRLRLQLILDLDSRIRPLLIQQLESAHCSEKLIKIAKGS
ncbi:MAG: hypothetical protein JWQ35_189, partial [Bacteriovoracaceae bacterium]|nr:hypothetical protein [Bacteriovoracaceae bacterium]